MSTKVENSLQCEVNRRASTFMGKHIGIVKTSCAVGLDEIV